MLDLFFYVDCLCFRPWIVDVIDCGLCMLLIVSGLNYVEPEGCVVCVDGLDERVCFVGASLFMCLSLA